MHTAGMKPMTFELSKRSTSAMPVTPSSHATSAEMANCIAVRVAP